MQSSAAANDRTKMPLGARFVTLEAPRRPANDTRGLLRRSSEIAIDAAASGTMNEGQISFRLRNGHAAVAFT
jgi:hypothetical protein